MAQAQQGLGQPQVQVDPVAQAFQDLRLELANVSQALTDNGLQLQL